MRMIRMIRILPEVANGLLSALLSPPCAVCGRVADRPAAGAVCEACWASIRFLTPPLCDRCGDPVPRVSPRRPAAGAEWHPAALDPVSGPDLLPDGAPAGAAPRLQPRRPEGGNGDGRAAEACVRCGTRASGIDRSRALGPYDDVLRDLVHALKYRQRRSVAPRLAALMRVRCGGVLAGADAVVPVPLHPRREWTRGFNQADEIARRLGLPRWPLLRRTRRTRPQADLEAGERWRNVQGAFALRRGLGARRVRSLRGACVVLVDDVSTTGATLEACATVLREGGAVQVRALTVARTLLGTAAPGAR